MRKLAAFDLEIARPLSGDDDWLAQKPGISCAAVALSDTDEVLVWYGLPEMGELAIKGMMESLWMLDTFGYAFATFNGAGFDFPLACEFSFRDDARFLARHHYDLFFQIFCTLGYSPGLDRIAKGLGLPGKPDGMDGSIAPERWQEGERQVVLDYLVQDVRTTLDVFRAIDERKRITWTSKAGNPMSLDMPEFLTVQESMALPEPDTGWMSNPWKRSKFVGWMDA